MFMFKSTHDRAMHSLKKENANIEMGLRNLTQVHTQIKQENDTLKTDARLKDKLIKSQEVKIESLTKELIEVKPAKTPRISELEKNILNNLADELQEFEESRDKPLVSYRKHLGNYANKLRNIVIGGVSE